jgi:hypothetical protein
LVPSPNVHEYVSGVPSGSLEPALENVIVTGALPLVTAALASATGARLTPATVAEMFMLVDEIVLVPSDTVRRAA